MTNDNNSDVVDKFMAIDPCCLSLAIKTNPRFRSNFIRICRENGFTICCHCKQPITRQSNYKWFHDNIPEIVFPERCLGRDTLATPLYSESEIKDKIDEIDDYILEGA